jgi:hypothetical protein
MYSKEDETIHVPDDNPKWRESHYFNFFDSSNKIGGYLTTGKRPAKGNSGYIFCLWQEGNFFYGMEYGKFKEYKDEWDVGALNFFCKEPLEKWKISFNGELPNFGPDTYRIDKDSIKPTKKSNQDKSAVELDLNYQGLAPFYRFNFVESTEYDHNYYEQIGQYTGTIMIGNEKYKINAYGMRNHVWGFRNWFAPKRWRWMSAWLEPEKLYAAIYKITFDDRLLYDGYLYHDGKINKIKSMREETIVKEIPESEKPLPLGMNVSIEDDTGFEIDIDAEVLHAVPTIFEQKIDAKNSVLSWNDKCIALFKSSKGHSAWGELEVTNRINK